MDRVWVVPLTSFAHGTIDAHEGVPIEIDTEDAVVLEDAGFIRVSKVPLPEATRPVVGTAGKVQDDGKGQPSSASQAAPASPLTTLQSSKSGASKGRKTGK